MSSSSSDKRHRAAGKRKHSSSSSKRAIADDRVDRKDAPAQAASGKRARHLKPGEIEDGYVGVDSVYGACHPVTRYQKLNRVGEGTYGIVYKARDTVTQDIVALKRVRMEKEKDGIPITALREVHLLKRVEHPNIVKLHDVVVGSQHDAMFLVFEYVEHDMAGLLDSRNDTFVESDVKCLLLQLLHAVAHLHDRWIIHRDLKLSNLLYSNKGQLKLADFGLARVFGEPVHPYTPKVVTLWYRAPELLLGATTYTTAIDMWAVGCIMGEFLLQRPLMPGASDVEQLKRIFDLLGAPSDAIWPGYSDLPNASKLARYKQPYNNLTKTFPKLSAHGIDLLNKLLTYDPNKRIKARQALQHPYFREPPLPKKEVAMPSFPIITDDGYRSHRKDSGDHGFGGGEGRSYIDPISRRRFGDAFG